VIQHATAARPEDRFATAGEIEAALQWVRDSGGLAREASEKEAAAPALALVEFTNLSGDTAIDWLRVGLLETLEGELRKISGLQVVSRKRVQQAMQRLDVQLEDAAALQKLGSRLGARWVGTGSFQRSGNRIRVTTRLVQVSGGETLPTEKVDGLWDDLFDVQDRVVAGLVGR
jgi:TolB-like protein